MTPSIWNLIYREPRLLILMIGLIAVSGLSAFQLLPRAEDPRLVERWALIYTEFPGASAERVEALITEPIERSVQRLDEVDELISYSRTGVSVITVLLRDDIDNVEDVWSRVRDRLNALEASMPPGASAPWLDDTEGDAYTFIYGFTWEGEGEVEYAVLRRMVRELETRLRLVPGTELTRIWGAPEEEILVEIPAADLAALGLTTAGIAQRIQLDDPKGAAGLLRAPGSTALIEVGGELDSIARVARTPLREGGDGAALRLGDIATVRKATADPPANHAIVAGKPAVVLAVRMESGRRIDHWAARIRQETAAFVEPLGGPIGFHTVFDQSQYVELRLNGLMRNLFFAMLLVYGVIFILMGWKASIMVGSALPLTALMVLSGLRFLDVPIHQMSVTGLIIALGLLIDNAIIMVDEVRHRLRQGALPGDAITGACRRLAVPLFGSTLTTMLAFSPIVLMSGPTGEFVGAMGISVLLALGSSFALALTIVPTLTGMLDKLGSEPQHRRWWHDGITMPQVAIWYRKSIDLSLAHPWLGVLIGIAVPLVGFVQASTLPIQFFPPSERDHFQMQVHLGPQASLERTREVVLAMRERMREHPEVLDAHWFVGASAPSFYYNILAGKDGAAYFAQAIVTLDSSQHGQRIVRELQEELDIAFPEATVLCLLLEQGPPYEAPIELRVFGPDLTTLRELGEELRRHVVGTPDITHTLTTLSDGRPKISLNIDATELGQAGLTRLGVASQLQDTLEGVTGGAIIEGTEQVPVRVRAAAANRSDIRAIESLYLYGENGLTAVPLGALGPMQLEPEIAGIYRIDTERNNTVQGFITAGVLPSVVLGRIQQRLEAANFQVPPGYRLEIGGEAEERGQAVNQLLASVLIIIVAILSTLVLAFSSFRIAGIIATVGFLSMGLGLAALYMWGYPFGFMAIVGTMGLVGIAINDSIVVLAAIRANPLARQGDLAACREVVLRSTRHVVATTVTTICGFLPLILSGGLFWPPLAIAIAGGVGGCTLLALYYVPSLYLLALRLRRPAAEPDAQPQPA